MLFHQFADDITLFTGVSHPAPSPTLLKLSSCLSALNPWFSQSQLKLNPTKSEVMFAGSSRLLAKYYLPSVVTLDGTTLPISSKLKILGVTLDSNLNFAHFISQIIQSSNFHIYAIKRVRKFLPLSTANALFISLVLSRLDYCNSLLCGQPSYPLCKLQALQNHAAKTVLRADYFFNFFFTPSTLVLLVAPHVPIKTVQWSKSSAALAGSVHRLSRPSVVFILGQVKR